MTVCCDSTLAPPCWPKKLPPFLWRSCAAPAEKLFRGPNGKLGQVLVRGVRSGPAPSAERPLCCAAPSHSETEGQQPFSVCPAKTQQFKVEMNRKNDKGWLNLTGIIQAGLLNKGLIKSTEIQSIEWCTHWNKTGWPQVSSDRFWQEPCYVSLKEVCVWMCECVWDPRPKTRLVRLTGFLRPVSYRPSSARCKVRNYCLCFQIIVTSFFVCIKNEVNFIHHRSQVYMTSVKTFEQLCGRKAQSTIKV